MITTEDLIAARTAWGDALVSISDAFETGGLTNARELAADVLDAAYGYGMGPVLFKPTLAGGAQTFRTTREGALSYFVGHDPAFPQDAGFAIMGWHEVRFETAAEYIDDTVAMWMGMGIFIDHRGKETKANKSFGYKKDAEGTLRIVLHHSSLPYEPEPG